MQDCDGCGFEQVVYAPAHDDHVERLGVRRPRQKIVRGNKGRFRQVLPPLQHIVLCGLLDEPRGAKEADCARAQRYFQVPAMVLLPVTVLQ